MSITFGSTSTEGTKTKTNVSVNNVEIKKADIMYNTQQKWQKKPDDIGIQMELTHKNIDWTTQFYVGGIFKAPDGTVEGWGSAYKVKLLLEAVGLTGARLDKTVGPEQQRFPTDLGTLLEGKKFSLLRYKNTKQKQDGGYYWSDWQTVAPENSFEELKTSFKEALEHTDPASGQPAPYIKNFLSPEMELETEVNEPANNEETATHSNSAVPEAPKMPSFNQPLGCDGH